jgi:hypothetical protein
MHLSKSAISFSRSSYCYSKLEMIPVILVTSSLYLAMAASSVAIQAAFSASILALKLTNKFCNLFNKAESAWTSSDSEAN